MAQQTQKCSSGIIGGISTGSIRISSMDSRVAGVAVGNNIFGIEGGFYTKIKISPLYFKPAVIIDYKRGTVDVFNSEGLAYAKSDFKMTRLLIPLLFGINVTGPVNAEVGLVYNHVLGVTAQYNGYDANIPRDGVGYRAGVNAELDRFTIGINYQTIKNVSITKGTFDTPDEIILSAAYAFGTKPGLAPYGK
jgi:hypothetical protein